MLTAKTRDCFLVKTNFKIIGRDITPFNSGKASNKIRDNYSAFQKLGH